jgi:hypothetical protein
VRRVVAVGLALGLAAVVGFLARAPLQGLNADRAALRFTWRLRGEEVVECRRPTEADLADLPVHMRNPDACVGDIPSFVLEVSVGGEPRIARVVHPAGARGDRPLYVFEELRVPPGAHRLEVEFAEQREPKAGSERAPVELTLETALELEPRDIALVTLDATGERLAVTLPGR